MASKTCRQGRQRQLARIPQPDSVGKRNSPVVTARRPLHLGASNQDMCRVAVMIGAGLDAKRHPVGPKAVWRQQNVCRRELREPLARWPVPIQGPEDPQVDRQRNIVRVKVARVDGLGREFPDSGGDGPITPEIFETALPKGRGDRQLVESCLEDRGAAGDAQSGSGLVAFRAPKQVRHRTGVRWVQNSSGWP